MWYNVISIIILDCILVEANLKSSWNLQQKLFYIFVIFLLSYGEEAYLNDYCSHCVPNYNKLKPNSPSSTGICVYITIFPFGRFNFSHLINWYNLENGIYFLLFSDIELSSRMQISSGLCVYIPFLSAFLVIRRFRFCSTEGI